MKRTDIAINDLPTSEVHNLLFHASEKPQLQDMAVYEQFKKLLAQKPIRHKRICLLTPPLLWPDNININAARARRYMTYNPYGSLVLSAAVQQFRPDWETEIVDLNVAALKRAVLGEDYSFAALLKLIPDDCDMYGVTWMFASAEKPTLHLLQTLKEQGKFVVTGGTQATNDAANVLNYNHADVVVKREGETQLCRMLSLWEETQQGSEEISDDSAGIMNIDFRLGNEIFTFRDGYENPFNLDIRQAFHRINLDDYNLAGSPNMWTRLPGKSRKFANVLSTRGCRGKCIFCQVTPFMSHGVRSRSISDVVDEIRFLHDEKGVRHIEWVDDDLLADRDHVIELFNRIKAQNLDVTFSTGNGVLACSINEEMVKSMADCGFVHTGFGVETGSEVRMKTLRKPASLKNVKQACELFKQHRPGVWLHANFMVGYPNETHGEMRETFDYAKSLQIDWCACMVLQPLLNTPIYNDFVANNDERVMDRFGKGKYGVASPGRDSLYKGKTFDDIFTHVVDFRDLDPGKIATKEEIQQYHIYFTVFVNLLGNKNLNPNEYPERLYLITEDTLKAYPFDPMSWAINAKAALLMGNECQFEISRQRCRDTLAESWYWREFFALYELYDRLDIGL